MKPKGFVAAASITSHDPYVPRISFDNRVLQSESINLHALTNYDAVVIVTDHTGFDPREIVDQSRLVIDARNLTRGIDSEKIVRL